MITRAKSAY